MIERSACARPASSAAVSAVWRAASIEVVESWVARASPDAIPDAPAAAFG